MTFHNQIVLLFCGLPGSGKSTFIQEYQRYLENRPQQHDLYNIISFDDIGEEMEWNENTFHTIREIALEKLQNLINQHYQQALNRNENAMKSCQWIFLDDTMHLRSMRREIYVICRDHQVPFFTVWMDCDPRIAQERVLQRNQLGYQKPVEEVSFSRICEQFQPPNQEFIFDRNCLRIDGLTHSIEESTALLYQTIERFLQNETATIAQQQQQTTTSSNICSRSNSSILQDIDNDFRKIVSLIMKKLVMAMSNDRDMPFDPKRFGNLLQKAKLDHFCRIRMELASVVSDYQGADLRKFYCIEFVKGIRHRIHDLHTENATRLKDMSEEEIIIWKLFDALFGKEMKNLNIEWLGEENN